MLDMKKQYKIWIFLLLLGISFLIVISFTDRENKNFAEPIVMQKNETDPYGVARKNMVETQLKARDIYDEDVLEVMERVPRHEFLTQYIEQAYDDHPVPIGYGQTISQPYIVALMTQSLEPEENDKVLEIGTGSGYQAAVLAELVKEVYTIEIVKPLAEDAEERLKRLGYDNVFVKHGDGYFGWEEHAPFDKIIITAAANHIPPPLLEQLKDSGKLIVPLGSMLRFQTLTLVTKKDDDLDTEFITGVRFVPMTGEIEKKAG